MDIEMIIHKARRAKLDDRWRCDNAKSPFSRMYFIRDGVGEFKYQGKTMSIKAGHVYLIPAELTFSYSCVYLEKLFFHVSLLNFERYDIMAQSKEIYEMECSDTCYAALDALIDSPRYLDVLQMKSQILSVILDFCKYFSLPNSENKMYSELVEKVITYIKETPKISLRTQEISNVFFVSQSKIRNDFLKETGMTIGKYIDDMVFMKAKQLLADKSISICEISRRLGFCDQFYFSRRFKEKFHITPSVFRNTTR